MAENADLLVEIGTEELPARGLKSLSESFSKVLCERLTAHGLSHGEVAVFATPRRIAAKISNLPASQPDREFKRRGPSLDAAFDESGKPTKAALGFARACGVAVDKLERMKTGGGSWLLFRSTEVGETTTSLIPKVVEDTLNVLPLRKRMRWANFDFEFIRPVHWVVLLFGNETVDGKIFGVSAGRMTRGHRFHGPESISIEDPASYSKTLYSRGHVVAEFKARADIVTRQVVECAASVNGKALVNKALIEEITALVEWPSAIVGSFDKEFLNLPDAVLVATMSGHQRYVPIADKEGKLLPHFIAVSNIESINPETVRKGNERVLRPRLKDAAYFYQRDSGRTLDQRQEELKTIVFQEKLGSMFDKAERISRLASHVAIAMGESPDSVKLARRAGRLCKCDLLTEMVGEFPELQGVMGGQYAANSGESPQVAKAIAELYKPRFAGDTIPVSPIGQAVAIADKLDTLAGIFGVGQGPTGDKDPYALRRMALGVLRILIEGKLSLDLKRVIREALKGFNGRFDDESITDQVYDFMTERLRAYFTERGVPVEVFLAVLARNPTRPLDFAKRVQAVTEFQKLPEAESLASANKRINNILKQAEDAIPMRVNDELFTEDAEWNLAAKLVGLSPGVKEMLKRGDYTGAMKTLAGLRENVDAFFDTVKVMDEDEKTRYNRLALLNSISELFMETADISRLS